MEVERLFYMSDGSRNVQQKRTISDACLPRAPKRAFVHVACVCPSTATLPSAHISTLNRASWYRDLHAHEPCFTSCSPINFLLFNDTDTSCLSSINLCLFTRCALCQWHFYSCGGLHSKSLSGEWRPDRSFGAALGEVDFKNKTQSCPSYSGRSSNKVLCR